MILYAIREVETVNCHWWYLESENEFGWVKDLTIESCYLSMMNCIAEYDKILDRRRRFEIVKVKRQGRDLVVIGQV